LKYQKNICRQLHFVKWNTCKWQKLNKFNNFWIMYSWRHNHWRLFKSWLWMKFSIVFGEAFARLSNLKLWNFFEPFWKNEGILGKTWHLKKKCLKKSSPPITSNKLQTIVNINKNKSSFKCHVCNEKNYISLNKAKIMVSFKILTKYVYTIGLN
jgi:hypothetical protein